MQTDKSNFAPLRNMGASFSAALLVLHFYCFCYAAFAEHHWTSPIADRLALDFLRMPPLHTRANSRLVILFFVALTLIGAKPTSRARSLHSLIIDALMAVALYWGSDLFIGLDANPTTIAVLYILSMLAGLYLYYTLFRWLAGRIHTRLTTDIFNTYNESFPQMEHAVTNPYSIHFHGRYRLRGQTRDSVVSLPDIFRGTLIIGVPGSGKTRYLFQPIIRQSLAHGMALFVYDLKYDDLTRMTYHSLQANRKSFKVQPGFYSFNFDDLERSHRCNVLDPAGLEDISDAADTARTIQFGMTRNWAGEQGEFFTESAINFLTACIWFLRRYDGGRYCTLPHLIELIQTDYYLLFSVLRSYPEIESRVKSFVEALQHGIIKQLQGQIDSTRIPLSSLASPKIYWLLSESDFTLDINEPRYPKVVCAASNPKKQGHYGVIISLLFNRMLKNVSRKDGLPCHVIVDEAPSFRALGLDLALAQARSNKVAITVGIQDLSQLRMQYGHDAADALMNLPANLLCGQVSGDTARQVSDRHGRILQEKTSTSTGDRNNSTSETRQLDPAVPPSKIAMLSSGEFVGIMADTPDQPIALKAFHCRIGVDKSALAKEEAGWGPLPKVHDVTKDVIDKNFVAIQENVRKLVRERYMVMQNTPGMAELLVVKKQDSNGQPPPA